MAFFGGCCVAVTAGMYAWAFRRTASAALACALFLAMFPLSYWDWAWPSSEMIANVFVGAPIARGSCHLAQRQERLAAVRRGRYLWLPRVYVAEHVVQRARADVRHLAVGRSNSDKVHSLASIGTSGLTAWSAILVIIFATGDLPMYFWTVFEYPHCTPAWDRCTTMPAWDGCWPAVPCRGSS